jgi:hypothetical protein
VRVAVWIAVVGLAVAGCGEEERERASAEAPAATATPTKTPDPAPVERARSADDCLKLWNADTLAAENYQVSAKEFIAELARKGRTPVLVEYQRRSCYVVAPIGPRRIAWFTAAGGHAPYSVPQRRNLERGERVPYNARALRDGRIAPGR